MSLAATGHAAIVQNLCIFVHFKAQQIWPKNSRPVRGFPAARSVQIQTWEEVSVCFIDASLKSILVLKDCVLVMRACEHMCVCACAFVCVRKSESDA